MYLAMSSGLSLGIVMDRWSFSELLLFRFEVLCQCVDSWDGFAKGR